MRKICILSIFLAILLLGCQPKSYDLPMSQEQDQITKVELSKYPSGKRVVLCELAQTDALLFVEKLKAVPCYRIFNDPNTNNDYLSVHIYYQNGIVDILGTEICSTTSDSKIRKGWYSLDDGEMWELFSEYIPAGHLPPKR